MVSPLVGEISDEMYGMIPWGFPSIHVWRISMSGMQHRYVNKESSFIAFDESE